MSVRAPSTMAASSPVFKEQSVNVLKDSISFEKEVKEKLSWTKERWIEAGQANSKVQRLCNSLNFWKKKLKPAIRHNSVILTLFNEHKDSKMHLFELVDAVEALDEQVKVCGYSEFRNPRYMCLYFTTEEGKECVRSNFKMMNDNHVVFMEWALDTDFDVMKVHWLPMALDIELIKAEVEKYADIVECTRKSFLMMNGRALPSGKITFKVKFKKTVKPESVPHLTTIGDMEALVTVRGRLPLCLNCGILGHISKECKHRYCGNCRMLKYKDHTCQEKDGCATYANVLKKGDQRQIDPDDWGSPGAPELRDQFITKQTEINKQILAEQITKLERQISNVNELNRDVTPRIERKRKATGLTAAYTKEWGDECSSHSSSEAVSDAEVGDNVSMDSEIFVGAVNLTTSDGVLPLSFSGNSSLTQSPQNKKTYAKSGRVKKNEAKAQKDFDKMSENREFVFRD